MANLRLSQQIEMSICSWVGGDYVYACMWLDGCMCVHVYVCSWMGVCVCMCVHVYVCSWMGETVYMLAYAVRYYSILQ